MLPFVYSHSVQPLKSLHFREYPGIRFELEVIYLDFLQKMKPFARS
jgi:hypothetical protein